MLIFLSNFFNHKYISISCFPETSTIKLPQKTINNRLNPPNNGRTIIPRFLDSHATHKSHTLKRMLSFEILSHAATVTFLAKRIRDKFFLAIVWRPKGASWRRQILGFMGAFALPPEWRDTSTVTGRHPSPEICPPRDLPTAAGRRQGCLPPRDRVYLSYWHLCFVHPLWSLDKVLRTWRVSAFVIERRVFLY